MSRKRPPAVHTPDDAFRRGMKSLDKRLQKDLDEALDGFTKRVETTLQRLHDRLRAAS